MGVFPAYPHLHRGWSRLDGVMSVDQARRIALHACVRKRPRTLEDAEARAEEKGIEFYACPFSRDEYHYHLTSGRRSRSKTAIRRAAERLDTLGPLRDG